VGNSRPAQDSGVGINDDVLIASAVVNGKPRGSHLYTYDAADQHTRDDHDARTIIKKKTVLGGGGLVFLFLWGVLIWVWCELLGGGCCCWCCCFGGGGVGVLWCVLFWCLLVWGAG
ncbi:hypothetical protein RA272_27970, partial [Pseudomonas syringae pv. tagetis]|uniref:hypothetical protein n=1 Tax=Pseudomonas syringae group genomosp. 7 TaxID=251699 RepID=UPI0037702FEC